MSTNSTKSKKLEITYSIDYLNPYKNISNDGFTIEKPIRYTFESNKLLSIDHINLFITKNFLPNNYNYFHGMKNKSIEFNFSTINNGTFGITDWFLLDQTLSEDEWINRVSKIDINKTLSLYDGDEKKFEENIKRDKFFLTFRFRPNIGYGNPDSKIGFCFFDALRDANVINITKRKISNGFGSCIYDYNNSMESVYIDIIDHIQKLNSFNEKLNERNKSKGKMNKIIYIDDKGGIDFNDMPELEKFFKCNIFINYNNHFKDKYISPNKFNKTVYLNFHNGHYELDTEYNKPVFDFYDDKKLYVGNKKLDILIHDKEKYYNGKDYFYKKNLSTEQTSLLYNSKHIINYKRLKKYYDSDDIKTIHDLYKSDCDELEKYGIKLLHSPSLQKALFQMLKLDIRYLNIKTERVTDYAEYEILKNGTKGGYNYIYKYDEIFKDVYSYDVKSSYPSILNHPDFKIPIKRGDYKYVAPEIFKKYIELKTDKNGFYKIDLQYGLYKCKISKPNNNITIKFNDFRINEYNIYTHFDILLAKILGYDIELLNENIYPYVKNNIGKPFNCFTYKSDELIDSNIIFRKLVKKLFDIKQKCKGNRIIKIMSSGIWGNLCDDKTYKTKSVNKDGDTFNLNLEDNEYFINAKPNIKDEDNIIDCRYKTTENLTRTSLFRMKPFLLSYQRYIMYIECIKKIEDAGGHILKIKIDGVYTDKFIDVFENKENKSEYIDGDIVREKHFDIILFKDKTYYLTSEQDIEEYLISKNTKKPNKSKKK